MINIQFVDNDTKAHIWNSVGSLYLTPEEADYAIHMLGVWLRELETKAQRNKGVEGKFTKEAEKPLPVMW